MGLGVYFAADLAHILRGVGEGVSLLVTQRGLQDAADTAYVAGYYAALRAVATSLGLDQSEFSIRAEPSPRALAPEARWRGEVWDGQGRVVE